MKKGSSFRDAYINVGNDIENDNFQYDKKDLNHTHQGSIGNLCLDEITHQFHKISSKLLA